MSAFYPLPDGDTDVPLRLLFGSAMLVSMVMGVLAIRRRDFVRHSVWMTRAYAIALGAGTQALVIAPWILLAGPPSELIRALLMGLAWVINVVVAEYIIHRRSRTAGPQRAPLRGRTGSRWRTTSSPSSATMPAVARTTKASRT